MTSSVMMSTTISFLNTKKAQFMMRLYSQTTQSRSISLIEDVRYLHVMIKSKRECNVGIDLDSAAAIH